MENDGRCPYQPQGFPQSMTKYVNLIKALDPDTVYTPAAIAQFGRDNGYIEGATPEKRFSTYQRIRIAMGRFAANRPFPTRGDGMVLIKGQAPTPGWYGWRWQKAVSRK